MSLTLGLLASVFAFTACDKNDENDTSSSSSLTEKGDVRQLVNIKCDIKCDISWSSNIEVKFFYNEQGSLNGFRQTGSTTKSSTIIETDNSISWKGGNNYIGFLENGHIVKLIKGDRTFYFSYEGVKLNEVRSDTKIFRLTWNGDNISKVEGIKTTNQETVEWVEYTYTRYLGGMLSSIFYFNPLGEFDLFDTIDESIGFLTGLCGPLSKNTPQSAKSWSKYKEGRLNINNETLIRNYYYEVDNYNYPISVNVLGDDFIDSNIDTKISLTWK